MTPESSRWLTQLIAALFCGPYSRRRREVWLAANLATLVGAAGLSQAADSTLQLALDRAVAAELARPRTNQLKPEQLAVSLVSLPPAGAPTKAAFRGDEAIYPASVVKLFYLAAAHRWMADQRLADTPELRRALRDMIVDSSNDATHYVLDLLTSTTSGPELSSQELATWADQRQAVNRWFAHLGYPTNISANKKPWCEGPYGREKQAIEAFKPNRNLLTTDATARLWREIATDQIVSTNRCHQMRSTLERDPQAAPSPEDQLTGFIANGLPKGAKLWSKAGWTSQTRHDSALIERPDGRRLVLVIFTTAHAHEVDIIPNLTRTILATLP